MLINHEEMKENGVRVGVPLEIILVPIEKSLSGAAVPFLLNTQISSLVGWFKLSLILF